MARTTKSNVSQGTVGIIPDPVGDLDPVNKESLPHPGPTPTEGLHSERWFWQSTGPDQQVNFDPLGRSFTGTADQFPGLDITLKRVHFWNFKASRAGQYIILRKNGSNLHTWTIPKGTGAQLAIDVSYAEHAGPPVTQDLGAWYLNGTAAGGTTYGLILVEYDIDNDI